MTMHVMHVVADLKVLYTNLKLNVINDTSMSCIQISISNKDKLFNLNLVSNINFFFMDRFSF